MLKILFYTLVQKDMLDSDDQTPDTMCHCLNLCQVDEGYDKVCHVFPLPEDAQSDPTGNFSISRSKT